MKRVVCQSGIRPKIPERFANCACMKERDVRRTCRGIFLTMCTNWIVLDPWWSSTYHNGMLEPSTWGPTVCIASEEESGWLAEGLGAISANETAAFYPTANGNRLNSSRKQSERITRFCFIIFISIHDRYNVQFVCVPVVNDCLYSSKWFLYTCIEKRLLIHFYSRLWLAHSMHLLMCVFSWKCLVAQLVAT